MDKRIIGIVGIAGTVLCVIAVALTVILEGSSPLGIYTAEFGIYSGGYFIVSSAMIFNLGIAIFGLCFAVMMVSRGLIYATLFNTIQGVFAALLGVACIAQAFITLNFAPYHYIASGVFYAAAFVLCALYIVFSLMSDEKRIASLAIAVLAGLTSAVYAVFTLAGGMSDALTASVSQAVRPAMDPFAVIGWAALVLIVSFGVLLSVEAINDNQSVSQNHAYARDIDF